jgi:hypothetical protein
MNAAARGVDLCVAAEEQVPPLRCTSVGMTSVAVLSIDRTGDTGDSQNEHAAATWQPRETLAYTGKF